jgi:hypothetical protein
MLFGLFNMNIMKMPDTTAAGGFLKKFEGTGSLLQGHCSRHKFFHRCLEKQLQSK